MPAAIAVAPGSHGAPRTSAAATAQRSGRASHRQNGSRKQRTRRAVLPRRRPATKWSIGEERDTWKTPTQREPAEPQRSRRRSDRTTWLSAQTRSRAPTSIRSPRSSPLRDSSAIGPIGRCDHAAGRTQSRPATRSVRLRRGSADQPTGSSPMNSERQISTSPRANRGRNRLPRPAIAVRRPPRGGQLPVARLDVDRAPPVRSHARSTRTQMSCGRHSRSVRPPGTSLEARYQPFVF